MLFLKLPVDIILKIISLLSIEDILSLKQTCRVLHALGCLDVVWHQITVDIPLDLPFNKDIKTLTSSEIQAIVIKALRLEHNWCGYPGRPRQLLQIQRDVIVHQMQHLRSQWLVTLTRSQLAFQLSIISMKDDFCYRIADCHAAAMSFFAVLQSESAGMIVTIEYDGMQTEHLNIYSFTLPHKQGDCCSTRLIHSIVRHTSEGTFSDIQICGDIVVASIARFMDLISPPSYELFFINIVTNVRWTCSAIPLVS
ncbi:hypothetical protein H2248_008381 [Termitomyces sp. 'cryptogamus']|nr:hypothetical protein H2248_008381 [Termitomyces sp. 'cryptogamus']